MAHLLLTGGAGFIGTALGRHLLAAGHDVVVVDRLDGARQVRNAAGLAGARVHRADLATVDLRPLLDGVDAVVHLAGRPGVQSSWATGFADHLRENVAVTQRLLEACLGVGVGRVVLASSSSVYGEGTGRPAHEDDPLAPTSPYGATKAAAELLAGTYAARGVPVVSLRYFTVYGPRQRPDMALHRILAAGLGGPPFPLRGAGRQVRDLTHVDDVAAATAAAVTAPLAPGTVLNVGGGRPVALRHLIDTAAQLLGRPVPIRPVPAAPGDPAATASDCGRARALLGWVPAVPLVDGVAAQLAWQAAAATHRPVVEVAS